MVNNSKIPSIPVGTGSGDNNSITHEELGIPTPLLVKINYNQGILGYGGCCTK